VQREIKFRVWNKNRNMFIIDGMTPKEIQDDATQSTELPMMKTAWRFMRGILFSGLKTGTKNIFKQS
jgi:hypothetical protein